MRLLLELHNERLAVKDLVGISINHWDWTDLANRAVNRHIFLQRV